VSADGVLNTWKWGRRNPDKCNLVGVDQTMKLDDLIRSEATSLTPSSKKDIDQEGYRRDIRRQRQTIVQRLNQDQSFRVLTQREGIVYAEGRFYEPKVRWTEEDGSQPILDFVYACPSLEDVTSEKGEDSFAADRTPWYRTSIFGLLSAVCDQQLSGLGIADDDLTREIAAYPIWLCDDDSRETMDFVGIDENQKKIVFLHAKMGKQEGDGTGFNVSSLQDVGRQALASLAFISRGEPYGNPTSRRTKRL
jgi:hypothetical protein